MIMEKMQNLSKNLQDPKWVEEAKREEQAFSLLDLYENADAKAIVEEMSTVGWDCG